MDRSHPYWLGLGFVFVFLAIDEGAKIHEAAGDLTEIEFDGSGYMSYPWVIPYSIFIVVLGFLYMRFFGSLNKKHFGDLP